MPAESEQVVFTDRGFTHFCTVNNAFNHIGRGPTPVNRNFGVNVFRSDLLVTKDHNLMAQTGYTCPAQQTFLHYTFTITPNEPALRAIRTRLLGPMLSGIPALVEYIDHFFGEDFLAWYYEEFYNAWAARI